jgi:hypothetical protein
MNTRYTLLKGSESIVVTLCSYPASWKLKTSKDMMLQGKIPTREPFFCVLRALIVTE